MAWPYKLPLDTRSNIPRPADLAILISISKIASKPSKSEMQAALRGKQRTRTYKVQRNGEILAGFAETRIFSDDSLRRECSENTSRNMRPIRVSASYTLVADWV